MDYNDALTYTVSHYLSDVLEDVGVSELTIRGKRSAFLMAECLHTLQFHSKGSTTVTHHFGSMVEGSTTPGLESDIDMLHCLIDVRIIRNMAEWKRGEMCGLMLCEDTAPGYCQLQLTRSDRPDPFPIVPTDEFTIDNSERVLFKNAAFMPDGGFGPRNGPAMTHYDKYGEDYYDSVAAFKCYSWPREAEEWIHRQRRKDWPAKNVIENATKHGFFLVPVGHKASDARHLEYRYSMSVTERALMISLNVVQIQCYVILKMIIKTFINPVLRNTISSYMCKTILLYCIEVSGSDLWQDRNLLKCITLCLFTLFIWIRHCYCPHFILQESNLFVGCVTSQNRRLLMSLLKQILQSEGRFLLSIPIDNVGQLLRVKLSILPRHMPTSDYGPIVDVISQAVAYENRVIMFFKYKVKSDDRVMEHLEMSNALNMKIQNMCSEQEENSYHLLQTLMSFQFHRCWQRVFWFLSISNKT